MTVTANGWQYTAVAWQGKKPIGWIGSHPGFYDRAGDVLHFTTCPLCDGTGKRGEAVCELCKEEDEE